MTTSQPPTLWEATSDADRKLCVAVMEHNAVLDKCLVKPSSDQPGVFVLTPQTIHTLKPLMALGKDYPQESNAFEGLYPKTRLKGLVNIDADVFEETKTLMVRVGNTVKAYLERHDGELFNTLYEFSSFPFSGQHREWEETALSDVCKAMEERNQRDIEGELKYIEIPHARCKDKFNDTRNNWINFSRDFVDPALLQKLTAKYKGPFTNPKAKNVAYLEWLSTDAATLQGKIDNLAKKIVAEEDPDIKEALQALSEKHHAEAETEKTLRDDVEKLFSLCAQIQDTVKLVIDSLSVVIEVNEKSCALSREIKACIQNPGLDLLNSRAGAIGQSFQDVHAKYKNMVDPFEESYGALRNGIPPML